MAIRKSNGSITHDEGEITQEFVQFYTTLLGSKVDRMSVDSSVFVQGACVMSEDWNRLEDEIFVDEVREALWDIDNDKSPGWMGLVPTSSNLLGYCG